MERYKEMLGGVKNFLFKIFFKEREQVKLTRVQKRRIWKETWKKIKDSEKKSQ